MPPPEVASITRTRDLGLDPLLRLLELLHQLAGITEGVHASSLEVFASLTSTTRPSKRSSASCTAGSFSASSRSVCRRSSVRRRGPRPVGRRRRAPRRDLHATRLFPATGERGRGSSSACIVAKATKSAGTSSDERVAVEPGGGRAQRARRGTAGPDRGRSSRRRGTPRSPGGRRARRARLGWRSSGAVPPRAAASGAATAPRAAGARARRRASRQRGRAHRGRARGRQRGDRGAAEQALDARHELRERHAAAASARA